MFSDPMYAAIIGAVIGFVARLVDNRMSDTKGTVLGYLKSMAFCAGLLSLWTFISSKRSTGGGNDFDGGYGYSARPRMSSFQPRPRPSQPFASQGYN
jgi:hypothetical protein